MTVNELKSQLNKVLESETNNESAKLCRQLLSKCIEYIFNKENKLLNPYYEGGLRSDNPYVNFYWDYCSQGKPAYAEVKFISLQEAIKVIEDNGGIPVLAHPGNNVKENKGNTDLWKAFI